MVQQQGYFEVMAQQAQLSQQAQPPPQLKESPTPAAASSSNDGSAGRKLVTRSLTNDPSWHSRQQQSTVAPWLQPRQVSAAQPSYQEALV